MACTMYIRNNVHVYVILRLASFVLELTVAVA
jgi:hypothetical protein